jgi:ubiquinone/menaquinone biosynthesis C-methylase UbiE
MNKSKEIKPAETCPWWICFTFDNFLRRMFQNPDKIMAAYIREGNAVLDIGPGMGYFTIAIAKLAGLSGRVIAADLQRHMLDSIQRRATKAGVQDLIILHQTKQVDIGVIEKVDFCIAFWMVHEVGDRKGLLRQIASIVKPGGKFLIAEPKLHVSQENFSATLNLAVEAGFKIIAQPKIFLSNTALLEKI